MSQLALILTAAAIAAGIAPARAGEALPIEVAAYPDQVAAAAAWRPSGGSDAVAFAPERTPDGRPALAFPCDMARQEERCYWDRGVALNLAGAGRIAFWVKADGDLSAASRCNLYFAAGDGWYGSGFDVPAEGWARVVLNRAQFNSEGQPAGWDAIRTIRFGAWKGLPRKLTIYMGGMEALADDIVVIHNSRAGREAQGFAERMAQALAHAGIDAGGMQDVDVENGLLAGKKVAIYPLNPQLSEGEVAALQAFVQAGGRVVACYTLRPPMAELLGLQSEGYLGQEYPGQFACMRFQKGALPGLPPEAKQASWNIERVRPAAKGARTLATWLDKDGKDTGHPAVVLSDAGAYISHVLLDDDRENKDRLLRALLGHLHPALWEQVAKRSVESAGTVSAWREFAQAEAGIRTLAEAAGRTRAVSRDLQQARAAYQQAEGHLRAARHAEVLAPAGRARQLLLSAYGRSQGSREGEFRGVWIHSAYGISGETWDAAIRRLKESGFNAIVPNMLWGGVADYPSEVLPVRDRVKQDGDQIAACLAACRKYGVELHVWKVDWNLSGAPKEFVDRMRAEGRLQRNSRGEETAWLCPSNPANFEMEKASLLEVARNYDVDGIHFDYIRYPGQESCYCDPCRARFEEGAAAKVANWPADVTRGGPHFAAYQEFRRSNITRLVKAVTEDAHRLKPWLKVSAAVFNNWPGCRESIGQDWGHWVEQGYLDFVCPMDYTDSNSGFRTMVRVQRDAVAARIPLYPGVGASAPGLPLDQVIDQVAITRAEGADGFILFQYSGEPAAVYVPALGQGATSGTTYLPHNAPVVEWRVLQGGQALAGPAKAGQPVQIEATLTTRGALRPALRSVTATVVLAAADDTPVKELGRGSPGGAAVKGEAALKPGLYRPVARGEMVGADGKRRPFVARGPFVRVEE